QAYSGTRGVGAEPLEAFEDGEHPLPVLRRDAYPVVADEQVDEAVVTAPRADPNGKAIPVAMPGGVLDQVGEQLAGADRVDPQGDVIKAGHRYPGVAGLDVGADVLDQIVQVHRGRLAVEASHPGDLQQILDQPLHVAGARLDPGDEHLP